MDAETENLYRRMNKLQNALGRWGRHDITCPAHGSHNCDKRCLCGLRSVTIDTGASDNARLSPIEVVIGVRGGVAEVESAPPGVEVEIKDYDNLEAETQSPYEDRDE